MNPDILTKTQCYHAKYPWCKCYLLYSCDISSESLHVSSFTFYHVATISTETTSCLSIFRLAKTRNIIPISHNIRCSLYPCAMAYTSYLHLFAVRTGLCPTEGFHRSSCTSHISGENNHLSSYTRRERSSRRRWVRRQGRRRWIEEDKRGWS